MGTKLGYGGWGIKRFSLINGSHIMKSTNPQFLCGPCMQPQYEQDFERERQLINEEPSAAAVNSAQLVMPEDGYEWRKYGQKYIRNINKIRSYFRCKNQSCNAKKKVEWHPSAPSDLRIVYNGNHDHLSKSDLEQDSRSAANQYELTNQVFGPFDSTSQYVGY